MRWPWRRPRDPYQGEQMEYVAHCINSHGEEFTIRVLLLSGEVFQYMETRPI